MTRADAVAAGLQIARRSGFATLTMAALAAELDVSSMTAYGYVRNKEELSLLVVDAVLAEVEIPAASDGDWSHRVALIERRARDALIQVRGASEVVRSYGTTPHAVRLADAIIGILREAGFGPDESILAFDTLFTYVTGQLSFDEALSDPDSDRGDARADFHRGAVQPTADELFDYGLATILRGLQANLAASLPNS